MLAICEYIEDHDLYLVIPVVDGKPSHLVEYVFSCEYEQLIFVEYFLKNPVAANFAYEARISNAARTIQDETYQQISRGI